MNRIKNNFSIPVSELENLKRRMLHWANQRDILLFLDNNNYSHTTGTYECLMGVGVHQFHNQDDNFSALKSHHQQHQDWLFGHIGYDFKNNIEKLSSKHPKHFEFGELSFFCPQIVCYIFRGSNILTIESFGIEPDEIWKEISNQKIETQATHYSSISFKKRSNKAEYIQTIEQLKQHIKDGDCYEINYCNEAVCTNADINTLSCFEALNKKSKAPFAAYYKKNNQYLLCASPERYLRKEGNQIIAQPIKGTAARSADINEDELQKRTLLKSEKERAENVMIVDLMRNDLARFCEMGSVKVDELFGIYSFPQVHQMISTIRGKLNPKFDLFDALKLSFPMGSMTGAPKIMVMQLIEEYEQARRELFSGCVGYIGPEGDFDFNVVIRSLFYNGNTKYLSYQTGGAITSDSIAEQEWEETCLKAEAIEKIFAQ